MFQNKYSKLGTVDRRGDHKNSPYSQGTHNANWVEKPFTSPAQLYSTSHRSTDRESLSGKSEIRHGFLWLRLLAIHTNLVSFLPWLMASPYSQLPRLLHVGNRLIFSMEYEKLHVLFLSLPPPLSPPKWVFSLYELLLYLSSGLKQAEMPRF